MAKKPSKASKLADEDLSQVPVITIPSSLWTAGCCVRGGTAAGNFAVFGANAEDPREQYTSQLSVDASQRALTTDKARGAKQRMKSDCFQHSRIAWMMPKR